MMDISIGRTMPSAIRATALGLLLAGCAGGPPTVVLDAPTGQTTLYAPSPEVPGAPPPPGLITAPPPIQTRDLTGTYAGIAEPLDTGGGRCISNQKVEGFRVRGRYVRWGQFRGTAALDGGVQMVMGQSWIYGQFEGPEFRGQLDIPGGRLGALGCTFAMTLQRVGP